MMSSLFRFKSGILIALSSAFLTCGYEFVRSPSNTLFKQYYGVENLPFAMAVMPLGVLFVLYIYNQMLNKLGPQRTLFHTTVFSSVILVLCFFLLKLNWGPASVLLYIYREAYIVLIIEQYWSFINSIYSQKKASKFNGILLAISSIGAISGGYLVHLFAELTGTTALLVYASIFTLLSSFFSAWAYRIDGNKINLDTEKTKKIKTTPLSSNENSMGVNLLFSKPILLSLATIVILTQIVSTTLSLNFQNILTQSFSDPNLETAYSGSFFAKVNSLALIGQLVLTPIVLKFFRPSSIHIAIALFNLLFCSLAFYDSSLTFVGGAYLLFKSLDYSLFRAAKEVLYIPFSFDVRFRSKELIDVFAYRFSKGGTSVLVLILQRVGVVLAPLYGLIAVFAAFLWFLVSLVLRSYTIKELETKDLDKNETPV